MSATAGKSILDLLWEKLDAAMDDLMDVEQPSEWIADEDPNPRNCDPTGMAREWETWGTLRGTARGLAEAIALITNVYEPDLDAVRAEAMERWETRP